jgi:hypothetical protein
MADLITKSAPGEKSSAYHLCVPKTLDYHPALNSARELRWIDKAKPAELLSNDDVVERVIAQVLSLIDRANRGEIPPIT